MGAPHQLSPRGVAALEHAGRGSVAMSERQYPSLVNRLLHELMDVEISPSEAAVLWVLAEHARPDGTGAFPSIARLVKMSHCSRSTVIRCIASLERIGLVTTLKRNGCTTRYNINRCHHGTGVTMEPVSPCDPTSVTMEPEPVSRWNPNLPMEPPKETTHTMCDATDAAPCVPRKPRNKTNTTANRRFAEVTGFPEWWDVYDNKKALTDAEKAWVHDIDDDTRTQLVGLTRDYLARRVKAEAAGTFVPTLPLPATFLRGARWEDEFDVTAANRSEDFSHLFTQPDEEKTEARAFTPPTGGDRYVWWYMNVYKRKHKTLPAVSWGKDAKVYLDMERSIGKVGVLAAIAEVIERPPMTDGAAITPTSTAIRGFHTKIAQRQTYKDYVATYTQREADVDQKIDDFARDHS